MRRAVHTSRAAFKSLKGRPVTARATLPASRVAEVRRAFGLCVLAPLGASTLACSAVLTAPRPCMRNNVICCANKSSWRLFFGRSSRHGSIVSFTRVSASAWTSPSRLPRL